MTDEEKAEEYANNKYCKFCKESKFCNSKCLRWDNTYTDFLEGLAEGRKEQENKDKGFCESFCMN